MTSSNKPHLSSPPETHRSLRLQDIGEYALIERIRDLIPSDPPELVVGIGDDAALWQPTPGYLLALTCDCAVEGQHFPAFSQLSAKDIQSVGYRAAQINLSDIAAMAASPRFALISLALPKSLDVSVVETFYMGLVEAFSATNVCIAGGNITATTGPFHANITLGGEVLPGKSRLRTGSQPGDWIGVTGHPGSAAAGLHCWLHPEQTPWFHPTHPDPQALCTHTRLSPAPTQSIQSTQSPESSAPSAPSCPFWLHPDVQSLLQTYLRPTARIREAQLLAPYLHALTDISDGLLLDLRNVLHSQNLGAILQASQLPHLPATYMLSQYMQKKPYTWTFSASDDYELLFTVPPEHISTVEQIWANVSDTPLHWIGQVISSSHQFDQNHPKNAGVSSSAQTTNRVGWNTTPHADALYLQEDGQIMPLFARGWQHFVERDQEADTTT